MKRVAKKMKKLESVESRAVHIAAVVMQAGGMCRYDTVEKCHRLYPDDTACVKCIERWLLSKARRELRNGRDTYKVADLSPVGLDSGLTDKNGTRIFQGDIVSLKQPHQKIPVFGVIEYGRYSDVDSPDNYDYLGWYIKVHGRCVSILQPPVDGIELEVIGNIHETPELLKMKTNLK